MIATRNWPRPGSDNPDPRTWRPVFACRASHMRIIASSFSTCDPTATNCESALPSYYDQVTRSEQDWVALLWLDGFRSPEDPWHQNLLRFGPRDASAWFVNPSDRVRRFALTMYFGADMPGRFQMHLSGWSTMRLYSTTVRPTGAVRHRRATALTSGTRWKSLRAATRYNSTAPLPRISCRSITGSCATSSWSSSARKSREQSPSEGESSAVVARTSVAPDSRCGPNQYLRCRARPPAADGAF